MDIKILFSAASVLFHSLALWPYLRDVFRRRTQPHSYSWLVWSITEGTAAIAAWYGGGRLGALNIAVGALMSFGIFILSFWYGTKNIKTIDTVAFVVALGAIIVWLQLDSPVTALLMVTGIDVVGGYVPSFRKSYDEPWTETMGAWLIFNLGNLLAILALHEYNLLTLTYLVTILTANYILVLICLIRRRTIPRPSYIVE